MDDFKKTNRAGRGIAMLFSNVGWGIAAVGLLLAIMGGVLGATPGSEGLPGPVTIADRLSGAGPGIGLGLFGLFSVLMAVQTRAALDTADMTRAMLAATRRQTPFTAETRLSQTVDDTPSRPAHPQFRTDLDAPAMSADAVTPAKSASRPEPTLKTGPRPVTTPKVAAGPKRHPIFTAKPPR